MKTNDSTNDKPNRKAAETALKSKSRASGGGDLLKTEEEMAKSLGLSKRSLARMADAKLVPYFRCGRLKRYDPAAVMAAMRKNLVVEAIQ